MFEKINIIIILFLLLLILSFFIISAEIVLAKKNDEKIVLKEIKGFITKINLDNQTVVINGTKYYLTTNSKIKVNGLDSSLKACKPISEGIYKYGEILVSGKKVLKIKSYYKIIEGKINKINEKEEYITVNQYKTPDNDGGERKYLITKLVKNNEFKNKLYELKKSNTDNNIVAAVGDNKILYIFKIY